MKKHPLFHLRLRHERERRGWSQDDIAARLGCDTKTVGRWESGKSLPRPYHRQKLCEILETNAEALGLVEVADAEDHATLPLSPSPLQEADSSPIDRDDNGHERVTLLDTQMDWGEAPHVTNLYGRDNERAELERWIEEDHCSIAAIFGIGGVGKTALAALVAKRLSKNFEFVFWRSLHNAPPLEHILRQCIPFLSRQHIYLPKLLDEQLSLLAYLARKHRCLFIFDNIETILQEGQRAGSYRRGYEGYGQLIQRFGEAQHQSCLLLTGREKPKALAHLEGRKLSPVRSTLLTGVGESAGRQLLQDKELSGTDEDWRRLIDLYSGNPLALRLIAEAIRETFGGDIGLFLQAEQIAFGDIYDLLEQQFQRLAPQEREILYWLAIEREATSLEELRADLVHPEAKSTLLETMHSLLRRSLIEASGSASFTLQPVIREYVTEVLVRQVCEEFGKATAETWTNYALVKAQGKDYVRESQLRLILAPVVQRLLASAGKERIEQSLKALLAAQRVARSRQWNYLAGNALNVLSYLQCDLRGADFSHLVIWQAHLQNTALPDVNFASAHFVSTSFMNTFGNVLTVAFHPHSNLVALGTTTGEIWLYDMMSATPYQTYEGHSDGVWSVAFSPTGKLLASSSDDATIRLWDLATGLCIATLIGHSDRVRAVAFSPDGRLLASGSDDCCIRLWDVAESKCLATLWGHDDRIWALAFSPDGRLLATGSTDQTVRLWDITAGQCLVALPGHSVGVRAVAFSPDGTTLASSGDDYLTCLWDVKTGRRLKILQGHTNRVWSVAFHPHANLLATASEDQTMRLWETSTGRCLQTLLGHFHGVRSVAFHTSGHFLVSGGDDQSARLWDTTSGLCLKTIRGYTNRAWSIAFNHDGSSLVSSGEDQCIHLWDVKTGRPVRRIWDPEHGVLCAIFSPDGTTIASAGEDQTLRLWDAHTGRCRRTLRGHSNWVRAIAFSPDGATIASGGEDQTVRLWDARTGRCFCILQGHESWVRAVASSPDGKLLASSGDDQTIRLWRPFTSTDPLDTLRGHSARVRSIAFSPDGALLASGSEDQTLRLWDVQAGEHLAVLHGHGARVRCVAFSPTGLLLASSDDAGNILLWELPGAHPRAALHGHGARVRSIAFSPDGERLASISDDGTIKLWHVQSGACLATYRNERPYERMNITGVEGLSEAQKATLRLLGAIEYDA